MLCSFGLPSRKRFRVRECDDLSGLGCGVGEGEGRCANEGWDLKGGSVIRMSELRAGAGEWLKVGKAGWGEKRAERLRFSVVVAIAGDGGLGTENQGVVVGGRGVAYDYARAGRRRETRRPTLKHAF